MLKIVLWNLGQLGNPPDNFFQSPKQDGYMKTAYGGLFLAGRKSVLQSLPFTFLSLGQDPEFTIEQWWAQHPSVPEF